MTQPFLYIALGAAALLLGGCASEPTCDYSDEPYMTAQSVPALRAPEGLSTPDRSGALIIPPPAPSAPTAPPTGESRCLDRPPSYFATGDAAKPDTAPKEAVTPK
ncbi:MAG: hypothetical protein H7Y02_06290 [Candidatus Obscuribacterales bacterium]|nr:hypothetical protein [Steroidobacteraceae bacterium]